MNPTIGIIGAGRMATALIEGLTQSKYPADRICVSCPIASELAVLHEKFKINVSTDNSDTAYQADILILAIKPHYAKAVLEALRPVLETKKILIISFMAGLCLETLQEMLPCSVSIIRAMPNLPVAVQQGMVVLYESGAVKEEDKKQAEHLFNRVGKTLWIKKQADFNAITALSGSGPAYFFSFMQALEEAGLATGLTPEVVRCLITQTALGSAYMVMQSEQSLEALCAQVAPKGGGTEQALQVLKQARWHEKVVEAVKAAKQRYVEMG